MLSSLGFFTGKHILYRSTYSFSFQDEGKDKALKSSQAFFSKLQDQVKMQISDAKKTEKKKKKRQDISVHKLKL